MIVKIAHSYIITLIDDTFTRFYITLYYTWMIISVYPRLSAVPILSNPLKTSLISPPLICRFYELVTIMILAH